MAANGESPGPMELPKNLVERIACQRGNDMLDLSLCALKTVPLEEIKANYGRINALDLSFNGIQLITPKFTIELCEITKLDLSRNDIKKLPDNFGNLKKLEYLDLCRNQLETLPVSMGEMNQLQYLRISENPFRSPMADLLDKTSTLSCTVMAEMVVKFLKEVSIGIAEGSIYAEFFKSDLEKIRSSRATRIYQHEEQIIHDDNRFEDVIENEADAIVAEKTAFGIIPALVLAGKVVMLTALWIVLIAVLIAFVVDTSYLENLTSDSALEDVWTSYYKVVHDEVAVPVAGVIPGHPPLYLHGPTPTKGFLGMLVGFFWSLFGY